jgi:SNF family Na+-dependent transporter
MVAYFASLLLVGIPVCWVEWTLGRQGGRFGFHSTSGIFHALIKHPAARYLGIIGFALPVIVYMYYVYIEAWALGYAFNAVTGNLSPDTDFGAFFGAFTGATSDGIALEFGLLDVGTFLVIVFALNLFFIYHGIAKGIETVCKVALPALLVLAIVVLVRVLTLGTPDAALPERNVLNGLGYLWNPGDVVAGLRNPQLWLAAAGQIFFSLSVGFGVIITYASYLRERDDIVLSGLTAAATNELCEVGIGGLITVPASFIFLGAAGTTAAVASGSFGLGFTVLPEIFARMPGGTFVASAFFLLLFLAALTSSLSMLQPGIAFLEETLNIKRKGSVALLGLLTAVGTLLVWYFSKDLKALDTLDFWVGTLLIFIQGTILVLVFGWAVGIDKAWAAAHEGAQMRIPRVYKVIIKYVTPTYLLIIFAMFTLQNVFGWNFSFTAPVFDPTSYVKDLVGASPNPVARLMVGFIVLVLAFGAVLVSLAGKAWDAREKATTEGVDA